MSDEKKIYTKKGDKGETSLIGGQRVPKNHDRIEAYGTLDELNSFIGLFRDSVSDEKIQNDLLQIQHHIFVAESILAQGEGEVAIYIPEISEVEVQFLENEIDIMNEQLPNLTHFLLPGGHASISNCHIVRCICRRAERNIIKVAETYEVPAILLQYVNRLSDYFFVLSRYLGKQLQVPELIWTAKKTQE